MVLQRTGRNSFEPCPVGKNDTYGYVGKVFSDSFQCGSHVCIPGYQNELLDAFSCGDLGLSGRCAVHAYRDMDVSFLFFQLPDRRCVLPRGTDFLVDETGRARRFELVATIVNVNFVSPQSPDVSILSLLGCDASSRQFRFNRRSEVVD